MNSRPGQRLAIILGLLLTGCESLHARDLDKSALSDELRNHTDTIAKPPPGCPILTLALPEGQSTITVFYQEPTTNQNGLPLTELAFTTIYITSPKSETKAIRVWTNDPHGGAPVTVHDIAAPTQNVGICVTATNWGRKESVPAQSTGPAHLKDRALPSFR